MEANKLIYYGIVKNNEIVDEAAYKLTNAFRRQHPDTLWDVIMNMRHVLVPDRFPKFLEGHQGRLIAIV